MVYGKSTQLCPLRYKSKIHVFDFDFFLKRNSSYSLEHFDHVYSAQQVLEIA